jgi:adenine deaminase
VTARVGSIAAGTFADIVAVEGDASSDVSLLTSPGFVMKNGKIVRESGAGRSAATRDRRPDAVRIRRRAALGRDRSALRQ